MSDLDSHLSFSHIQVSSDSDYLLELELFHDESLSREPECLNPATSKRHLNKNVPYRSCLGMSRENTPFLSAHLSVIAHATEDIQRVEQATRFIIELISKREVGLTRQYMKGHHGNTIITISAKLAGKGLLPNALELLSQKISESDRQFLGNDIGSCVDNEGNLYLRFNKQDAFLRAVKFYQGDPIRMRLKFVPGYDSEKIADLCKESGLMP
jgi:RNA binding exosome subunit